jgi:hypothetical protein
LPGVDNLVVNLVVMLTDAEYRPPLERVLRMH